MEESILIPIISALSALLGAAVNHYLQLRQQKSVENFQLNTETLKHQRTQYEVFAPNRSNACLLPISF